VSSFSIPVVKQAVKASSTTSTTTTTTTTTSALYAEANGATAAATTPKKVIVLGGDGFCGWPTCLYLSDQGHDVVMVDNLSRRNIDIELGCDSLTPIQSPEVSNLNSRIFSHTHNKNRAKFVYLPSLIKSMLFLFYLFPLLFFSTGPMPGMERSERQANFLLQFGRGQGI
jgi:hypothetical protein